MMMMMMMIKMIIIIISHIHLKISKREKGRGLLVLSPLKTGDVVINIYILPLSVRFKTTTLAISAIKKETKTS